MPNQTDEIGRLATVINDTFARLEASFDQLRRFTADASHELRTPLGGRPGPRRGRRAQRRSPEDYEEAIGSMLEEIDRMTSLVDTLLRLSQGDADTIRLSREPLDLGQLMSEVASRSASSRRSAINGLSFDITDDVIVSADRLVLREAVTNLLDNAIKYSPSGSRLLSASSVRRRSRPDDRRRGAWDRG